MIKDDAFAPVTDTELKVSVALPAFFTVTVCAELVVPTVALAKLSEVGESDTTGALPVPLSFTVCGEPAALSATDR